MPSPIKWDTLTRSKKALPRVWDSLTPEQRRKLFVGKYGHLAWCSFKRWHQLTKKETDQIKAKIHYKADVEYICRQIKKFMRELETINEHSLPRRRMRQ